MFGLTSSHKVWQFGEGEGKEYYEFSLKVMGSSSSLFFQLGCDIVVLLDTKAGWGGGGVVIG